MVEPTGQVRTAWARLGRLCRPMTLPREKGHMGLRPEPTHLRTPSPSTRSPPSRLPATGAYAPPNATGDLVALLSVRARVNSFPTSPSPRAEPLWLCPPCCWTLPPIESFLPLTRPPAPTYTATSGQHSSIPPIPQGSYIMTVGSFG